MSKKVVIKIRNDHYGKDNDIKKLIRYVIGQKRGKNSLYWNTCGCRRNYPACANNIIGMQERLEKTKGPRVKHLIVSFPREFYKKNDDFMLCDIANRIALYFFERFQVVYGVHNDTDNMHVHFVINAVSYMDGKKWHQSREEFSKMKKDILDIIESAM